MLVLHDNINLFYFYSCPFDRMTIYDGPDNLAEKIGTYCGQMRNLVIYSTKECFQKMCSKLFKFQICFIQWDPLNCSKERRLSRIIVYFMLLQSKYCFRVCVPCLLYYFNPNFSVTVVYLFNSFLGLTVTNLVWQIIRF